jgi:uncharacterized protein YcfJ
MKTRLLCLGLAALLSVPAAQAQVFRPETVRGAVVGGVLGAVIGHNDDRRGWEGAAIGAAAGALVGSFAAESRERHLPPAPRGWQGRGDHAPRPGWRTVHRPYVPVWGDCAWERFEARVHPRVYRRIGYDRFDVRPSREWARNGLLLGGVLGGIVGHNDGRRGWEGAAIGAGAGWLFGTLADREFARRESARRAAEEAWQASLRRESTPAAAAPVVHHHHYYQGQPSGGSLATANGLFGR